MRIRSLVPIVAAALAATSLTAQTTYTADFPAVRRLFLDQQQPRAAYTLSVASAYVRQELGRSRDETVGARLVGAEDRLDELVARLRASGVGSVTTLDSAFTQTDMLLAEHHWRLAAWELANPRSASRQMVGEDLGHAATFFAQSFTFAGREPAPAAAAAIAEAKRVSGVIATTDAIPKETAQVLDALGKLIVPVATVAIR